MPTLITATEAVEMLRYHQFSETDFSKIIENVKNLISSSTIYEKDLKNRITTFNSNINKLPEAEKDYLILKRKHEYNEQTAIYLQQKRYEASLAKAGTESDHKVIDGYKLILQR